MATPSRIAVARTLHLVFGEGAATPPWGAWSSLPVNEETRRKFTRFRAAINAAIAPHEVDHVDFTTEYEASVE